MSENAQLESHMTGGDMHTNSQGSNMDHVETLKVTALKHVKDDILHDDVYRKTCSGLWLQPYHIVVTGYSFLNNCSQCESVNCSSHYYVLLSKIGDSIVAM